MTGDVGNGSTVLRPLLTGAYGITASSQSPRRLHCEGLAVRQLSGRDNAYRLARDEAAPGPGDARAHLWLSLPDLRGRSAATPAGQDPKARERGRTEGCDGQRGREPAVRQLQFVEAAHRWYGE
jgi:hypothetical protein